MALNSMNKKSTLTKIGKGSLIVFVGIVAANFLGLFKEIFLARFLGVDDYGLFSLGFNIFLFLGILSLLGFKNGLVYFISSNLDLKKLKNSYIKVALKYSLLVSILISLLVVIFSQQIASIFNSPGLSELLIYFGLAIPLYVLLDISVAVARGHKNLLPRVLFFDIGQLLLFIVLFLVSSYLLNYGLSGVVVAFLLSYLLASIASLVVVNRKYHFLSAKNVKDKDITKKLFSYSWPIYFSTFFQQIVSRGSLIILGLFLTENFVGIFTASQKIALFINIPLSVLIPIFFPVVIELITKGEDQEADQIYKNISKWLVLLVLPFFIFALIFPESIIDIVFGADYLAGVAVFRLILISAFFGLFSGPIHNFLMAYRQTKLVLINTVFSAIINIGLSFALIPIYGLLGAGLAVAISIVINNLMGLIEYYVLRKKVLIPQSTARIFILALFLILIFGLASYLINNIYYIFLTLAIVVIGYYPLIKKIGFLDKTDKYLLAILKNKLKGYLKKA